MSNGMRSLVVSGKKVAQRKVLVSIILSLTISINLASGMSVFGVSLSSSSVYYGDNITIKVQYSGNGVLKIYDSSKVIVFVQALDNPPKTTLTIDTSSSGLFPDYYTIKIKDESGNDVWSGSFYVLPVATPSPIPGAGGGGGNVIKLPIVTPTATPRFNVTPIEVPQAQLIAEIDDGRIVVTHAGGDSIKLENIKAIVNGETALISPRTGTLSAGQSFSVYGVKLKPGNNELKLVHTPSGSVLLSASLFNPAQTAEIKTPTPIGTPVETPEAQPPSQSIPNYLLILLVLLLLPALIWTRKRKAKRWREKIEIEKLPTPRKTKKKAVEAFVKQGEQIGATIEEVIEAVGNSRTIKQDKEPKSKQRQLLHFPELDKYEFLEFIGEGGFAKVYKVRRKSDEKIVALKIPKLDEATGRSFLREVSVWQNLDHKNIVKLYDANVYPIPYLEMEYVEGVEVEGKVIRDLEHYPKPLEEDKVLKIIKGVAEGLRYAHGRGVVHRDLKPLNILLKPDLTPKITDWGLAKLALVSGVTVKGYSPLYAAPEQLDLATYGEPDERTDIYQLGVMFYELLTGKLPYEGYTIAEICGKITNPEIKPATPSKFNVNPKYDRIVMKCLEKRKENRFSSVDEFLRSLEMLEEKEKTIAELKKSLSQYKESLRKSRTSEELMRNRRMVVKLLGKLAVIHAEMGEKAELLNCLEDLKFYTTNHADELMNAINMLEYMIRENVSISEQFVDGVKNLVHEIGREVR